MNDQLKLIQLFLEFKIALGQQLAVADMALILDELNKLEVKK